MALGTWSFCMSTKMSLESIEDTIRRLNFPSSAESFLQRSSVLIVLGDVCVIDNLVKPAVHNMTIEEIEKELGYKINIINKENSNAQT